MKDYCVKLTQTAQEEISSILDYIAVDLCSPAAAIKLNDKINEQFERLKMFPLSGEAYISEIPLRFEYRRMIVDNYLIFYTVREEDCSVIIVHVLYASSDYRSVL